MKKVSFIPAILVILMISLTTGCSSIYDMITKTVTASGDTLQTDILEIRDVLEGDLTDLSDSILQFLEGDRMNALIDSVVTQASESFVEGLNLDSVLGVVDNNLDEILAGVLDSLLSENVSSELGLRIKEVLETSGLDPASLKEAFLNDETTAYLVSLKDELLGNSTTAQIDSLMEAALAVFEKYYDRTIQVDIDTLATSLNRINNNLGGTADKATNVFWKVAVGGLGTFLLALASILGFRIYKSKKQTDLILTIADVINQIEDQKTYDKVTQKIKETTKLKDLDELLDKTIQPIKEKSAKEWENKDNQVLRLLTKYMAEKSGKGNALESFSTSTPMEELKKEAASLGLEDHLESVLQRYAKNN